MLCLLLTADDSKKEIVGISCIEESFVPRVERVACGCTFLQTVQFPDCLLQPVLLGLYGWVIVSCKRYRAFSCTVESDGYSSPFLRYFTRFALVEFLLLLFHELVEFMEVDIGKNGGIDSALWCPTMCLVVLPIFDISRFQHVADEVQKLSILNSGSYLRRDNVVSVLYAEGLNSTKSSVFLQRTDRHGIVGQKS